MSRDIDDLISTLKRRHPEISVEQHPAAQSGPQDAGVWFIRHPRGLVDVQIESATGTAPFLVESELAPPVSAKSVDAAVRLVVDRLGLSLKG